MSGNFGLVKRTLQGWGSFENSSAPLFLVGDFCCLYTNERVVFWTSLSEACASGVVNIFDLVNYSTYCFTLQHAYLLERDALVLKG